MRFVLTPDWFLGKDVMIEGFSFLVLLAFFVLCWRYYRLSKKKSFLYLGSGFLLIAVAQLATIITRLVLYYDTTFVQQVGQMVITYHFVKSVDFFYYAGFFFYKLLTLLGLYIIYRLPLKKKSAGDLLLAVYFILLSAFFGTQINFIFHITAIIFLVLIIRNYYMIYKENKARNTQIVIAAFGLLALAHVIMVIPEVFDKIMPILLIGNLAVISNIIELISYLALLMLIVRILKYGKKKKPYGHNP